VTTEAIEERKWLRSLVRSFANINEGGQAIIGNVKPAQSGALGSSEHSDGGGG
jgi:hypothetical protein